jgi:hypothetical protein
MLESQSLSSALTTACLTSQQHTSSCTCGWSRPLQQSQRQQQVTARQSNKLLVCQWQQLAIHHKQQQQQPRSQ